MPTTITSTAVIEQIQSAGEYHCAGKRDDAAAMLASIDTAALQREYEESAQRIPADAPPIKTVPIAKRADRALSPRAQVEIFQRDRFICRYSGKKTIFVPTLRSLALLYPEVFPYQANWKIGDDPMMYLYVTHGTSCDYIEPLARGGVAEPGNIATTTTLANLRKGSARLEEIGWELRPSDTRYWDGLSNLFVRLSFASAEVREDASLQKWRQALLQG